MNEVENLTVKETRFCQEYASSESSNSASEAYRAAYSCENMNNASIRKEASRLLAKPRLATKIQRLRDSTAKRCELNADSIIIKLEAAYQLAMANDQTAAAVQASMGMAKVAGLIVDKRRDETPGTKNPDEIEADIARMINGIRNSGNPADIAFLDTLLSPQKH